MGSLFAALQNSAQALQVYNQALQVVENNVTNANTPGYANQTATFIAQPFDPSVGLPGGVAAGTVQSSRDAYAEQNVRNQQTALGYSQQKANDLSQLENLFPVSGSTGIGNAINGLISSFSALSINPNDTTTRQTVLTAAGQFAQAVNGTATGLASAAQQEQSETQASVSAINTLAQTIAQLNTSGLKDLNGGTNSGADAELNSSLEQLSQYTNFTALQQPNGSVTVYIGGQTPLVIGSQTYAVQAGFNGQQAAVLDSNGGDITNQITGGQLAAQIEIQNQEIPSYTNQLNTLAQSVADQVNATLNNGVDQNGNAPVTNLFTYNSVGVASSLAVDPSVTPDQIAAALPGAPGGNGNALNLAALGNADGVNGATFATAYGQIASQVGTDISNAQNNSTAGQQTLTQAQSLRSQISGVSLDASAEQLIQYQRSYQATAQLITILDNLTSSVINMLDTTS